MSCRIIQGHSLVRLRELPSESVHCIVCSPPYYGKRDYKTEPQIWGGDALHSHIWEEHIQPAANGILHVDGMSGETLSGQSATRRPKRSGFCSCGAWKGELGLEPTPALFVEHLVEIFQEARRVLKKTGVLWCNLGDSYAGSWGAQGGPTNLGVPTADVHQGKSPQRNPNGYGLKRKDLIGIPWRVAFALQDDGWFLRSDVIWQKPNQMPSSVKDRPTTDHEYVFLLSKSRKYWYDADAIAEPLAEATLPRAARGNTGTHAPGQIAHMGICGARTTTAMESKNERSGQRTKVDLNKNWDAKEAAGLIETRNKRTVWTIPTQSYPEDHFAAYPEELARTCILAGCPEGGVVLDMFGGRGTTGVVAEKLGRNSILIELNPDYVAMIERNVANVTPAFQFGGAA